MKIDYIGYALAFISFVYAYYLYKKGLRLKEPVVSIKSNNLISGYSSKYKNLELFYKKEKVESFTVSKILFFNRGAETIHHSDVSSLDQIQILPSSGKILDVAILQVNNPSNDFSVNHDKSKDAVVVDFDYIDNNQGVVIQIVHTGSSFAPLKISGSIKGVKKVVELSSNHIAEVNTPFLGIKRPILSRLFERCFSVTVILGTVWLIYLIYIAVSQYFFPASTATFYENLKGQGGDVSDLLYTIGFMLSALPILALQLFRRMRKNMKLPDGLEAFLE